MVASRTDRLRPEMEKLQGAIKRVGENWNDVVAQGIQTAHVNMLVSACNNINTTLLSLSTNIESDLNSLEEFLRSVR